MKKSVQVFALFAMFLISFGALAQTCPQISTYFGDSQIDEFKGICKDKKGNFYLLGNTTNSALPVTPGAFQTQLKGDYESFIVKLDSCGNIVWCTYFGTSGFERGERIAYSNDSTIVITGSTDGNDLDTTFNCFQSQNNGTFDGYLAKFDLNGQPKWITYFGGTQADFSYAIDIDRSNNIIIGGTSLSPSLYPSSQSFQSNLAGAVDAFIAKFNKNGNLIFSTFYGGSSSEDIHDVGTDSDKNIVGIGGSFSNNLSTTANCLQPSSNGGMEIYVIKLDSAGNRMFSTYIGGSLLDDAYGLTFDSQKNIYLTGHTSSPDFYQTAVSYQSSIAGSTDNFCMKLDPSGNMLWSTIFGGTGMDNNVHSAMDDANNIFALVNSQSSDYPMLGSGNFTVNNGAADVVLAKINQNGLLVWTSYKGGSGNENAGDLLLLKNKVLVCGGTSSADFPVINGNYQMTNAGQDDGFLSTFQVSVTIIVNTGVQGASVLQHDLTFNYDGNVVSVTSADSSIEQIELYDCFGKLYGSFSFQNGKALLIGAQVNQVYFVRAFNTENVQVYSAKLLLRP
jgi:hypothetical protein